MTIISPSFSAALFHYFIISRARYFIILVNSLFPFHFFISPYDARQYFVISLFLLSLSNISLCLIIGFYSMYFNIGPFLPFTHRHRRHHHINIHSRWHCAIRYCIPYLRAVLAQYFIYFVNIFLLLISLFQFFFFHYFLFFRLGGPLLNRVTL